MHALQGSVKLEVVSDCSEPSSPALGLAGLMQQHWMISLMRLLFSVFTVFVSPQGDSVRLTQRFSITAQLLVLYYILSYEEALLANTKTLGKRHGAEPLQ
jgi:hypothetical protein